MTQYYIDAMTPNDFDAIIRFLHSKNKKISGRNKVHLAMSAELSEEELEELRTLPLEEYVSVGDTPLR